MLTCEPSKALSRNVTRLSFYLSIHVYHCLPEWCQLRSAAARASYRRVGDWLCERVIQIGLHKKRFMVQEHGEESVADRLAADGNRVTLRAPAARCSNSCLPSTNENP